MIDLLRVTVLPGKNQVRDPGFPAGWFLVTVLLNGDQTWDPGPVLREIGLIRVSFLPEAGPDRDPVPDFRVKDLAG